MKDIDPGKLNPEGIGRESKEVKKSVFTLPGIGLESEPEMTVDELDKLMKIGLALTGFHDTIQIIEYSESGKEHNTPNLLKPPKKVK